MVWEFICVIWLWAIVQTDDTREKYELEPNACKICSFYEVGM